MMNLNHVSVRQAFEADLDMLALLFDNYRQFYNRPSDLALARSFLAERFEYSQSVVFVAISADGAAVGFTQLYPSFSSLSARRTFILNDLYVNEEARRMGVGRELLRAAAQFGQSVGAVGLVLSTANDNESAQALYLTEGWVRETDFQTFNLLL